MKNINLIIDFFLVGAARCGTTSLSNYLDNHPSIFLPDVKEPNFFSNVESPKKEDYEIPKPNIKYHAKIIKDPKVYESLYLNVKEEQIKGDTSPSYIWDLDVAKRIYQHNPKAKILISLRHPVDRAYSHYIMNYYTGVDKSSTFELALKSKKNNIWGSCNLYLDMSMYYHQVKKYYDVFPNDQIKILVHEQWTSDIENSLKMVYEYLGLDYSKDYLMNTVNDNRIKPLKKLGLLNFLRGNFIKGIIKGFISQDRIDSLKAYLFSDTKNIPKIEPKLREKLAISFKDDIRELSELTGIDFNQIWKI